MQEPSEMLTASRMQNMVQSVRKTFISRPLFLYYGFLLLGLSASRSPAEGPFLMCCQQHETNLTNWRTCTSNLICRTSQKWILPLRANIKYCLYQMIQIYDTFSKTRHRIVMRTLQTHLNECIGGCRVSEAYFSYISFPSTYVEGLLFCWP